jgi:hypothetical protein
LKLQLLSHPSFTFLWGPHKNYVKIWETLFLWAFGRDHTKKVHKITEDTKCRHVKSGFCCIFKYEYCLSIENTQYAGSQPFYAPHGPQQVPAATTVSYSPSPAQQTVYTYAGPPYAQAALGAAAAPPRDDTGKQSQHSVYLGQPSRASLAALPPHGQGEIQILRQTLPLLN